MPPKKPAVFSSRKPSLVAVAQPEAPKVALDSFVADGPGEKAPTKLVTRATGPDKKLTVLYMPPELHKRLAVRCAEQGTTLSAFVAEAVGRAL